MKIKVELNQNDLNAVEDMLDGIDKGATRALYRATNKTIKTISVESAKRCGKPGRQLNMKASYIKRDFRSQKPTFNFISGYVECRSKKYPNVVDFTGTIPKPDGVSVKPEVKKARYLVFQAFLAPAKNSGKLLWFKRKYVDEFGYKPEPKTPHGYYYGEYREPIREVKGPAVIKIFEKPEVLEPITIQASTLIQTNLSIEVDEILRRYKTGVL